MIATCSGCETWRSRADTAERMLTALGWSRSHEDGYDVWSPPTEPEPNRVRLWLKLIGLDVPGDVAWGIASRVVDGEGV